MKNQLIKEARRFQQIAGLRPINEFSSFFEADDTEEVADGEVETDQPETRKDAPDDSLDVAAPEDLEKNVSKADMAAADKDFSKITNDVEKLRHLQGQLSAFLKMYKSGDIESIEQYKKMIGTIPQDIKKLEAKLNKDLTAGDDEEM